MNTTAEIERNESYQRHSHTYLPYYIQSNRNSLKRTIDL